jgi:hypothetical protein
VINASERVEVTEKTTQTPSIKKRGRIETTKKDNALKKRPRMEKTKSPQNTNKVNQPVVDQHNMNTNDPWSSTQARYTDEGRTSKVPNDIVLGNHEASKGIEENFINYTSSGEVYDRTTTIANLCFSTVIVENFINDPDPKTMTECKKCSDWNK